MSKKLNFGPMDEKCFISRSELLQWVNNLLLVSVTRVEQLGCGSIYCQIFDVIYPGKIPLNKLKWKAKHEYEFSHNFKLLQKGFDSVSVAKAIPIEKLIKAKYQDNLEFAQWMKRFFEINCKDKGRGYDPKKRRGMAEPDLSFCVGGVLPQYTMIYGNFKDMDREIATSDTEEGDNKTTNAPTPLNPSVSKSASTVDKENQNLSNMQQQPLKQSLSNLEPSLTKKLNAGGDKFTPQNKEFQATESSSANSIKSNSSNSEKCPFFLNNNQPNRFAKAVKFQTNKNNSSLIKALENKEIAKDDSFSSHSPSHSDWGLNEAVLNSGRRSQSSNLDDSDDSGCKLQQIKQLLSLFSVKDQENTPHLFSLLASIKSLVQ